ncbi:MAG TPA: arginase [Ktedonobacteraceae bacterium]|nr:arginase [Ktedonobacteraceae bacterium]
MNIHFIGVPLDLGAGKHGADLGPNAIRYAGINLHPRIEEQLRRLGHNLIDEGNLIVPSFKIKQEHVNETRLRHLEPIVDVCEHLAGAVERHCGPDDFPLVIGGDHCIALGSVTGVVKARGPVGVIWIDAHADFNTPETTPSGNIHGMPLAALVGIGDKRLVELGGIGRKVDPTRVVIIGSRDLDPGEKAFLREVGVNVFTMKEIDRLGLASIMEQAIELATRETNGLHISFDIDAVDPQDAPGVGTRVRGGLTYREAHLSLELIADSGKMTSLEIVEVNPILDHENRTATLAAELILSAFGKRIF